jgi:hypothetical protein
MAHQHMYNHHFLESYKNQTRTDEDDIKVYSTKFKSISTDLRARGMICEYTQCFWFLQGLPEKIRQEIIEALHIDLDEVNTMNFERMYAMARTIVDGRDCVRWFEEEIGPARKPRR